MCAQNTYPEPDPAYPESELAYPEPPRKRGKPSNYVGIIMSTFMYLLRCFTYNTL